MLEQMSYAPVVSREVPPTYHMFATLCHQANWRDLFLILPKAFFLQKTSAFGVSTLPMAMLQGFP